MRRVIVRDRRGRFAAPVPANDPVAAAPTQRAPRWRLRLFDRAWPWRGSFGSALEDAVASGNASASPPDMIYCLTVPAVIQRDPPHEYDLSLARRRAAALASAASAS